MSAQEPQESQDVDDRGRCKLHPGIQLRHQKRSGEWRVLLRACPLCVSGLPPTAPRPEDDAVPPTAAAAASSAAAVPDPGEGGGGVSRGGESGDEDGPDRLADSEKRRRKARRKDKERSRGERRGKRDGGDGKRTGGGRSKSRGGRDRDKSGRGGDDKPEKDEGGGPPPQQHPLRRKGSRSGGRPRSPSPEQSPRVEREQPSGEADGLPSPPIRHRTREDEAREYNSFVDFIQRDRQKMAAAAGTATAAQGPGQPPRRDVGDRGGEHDDGVDEEEEDDDHRTQVTQDAGTDESDRGDEDGDGSDGGSDADGRTVDEDREGPSEAVDEADDIGASLHSGGTRPSDNLGRNLSRRREEARSAGGYGGDPLPPPPPFRRRQPRQLAASCGPSYYGGGSGYEPEDSNEHDGPRDSDSDGRGGGEGVLPGPASGNFGAGNGDADGGGGGARVLEQDEVSVMSMSSVTRNIRRDGAAGARAPLTRHDEEEESSSSSSDDSSSSSSDGDSSSSSRDGEGRGKDRRGRKSSGGSGSGRGSRPGGDDVRSSSSSRNTRGSAERAILTFDPDERGFCRRHPTVRLRKKKLMRGWTVKLSNCPECCLDEMRRVKESRMRARRGGGGGSGGGPSSRRSGGRRRRGSRSGGGKEKRGPPISQLNYRAKDDDRSVGTASTITISSHTASGAGSGAGSVRSASPQKRAPAHVTRMPFVDATGRGGWYTGQVDPETGSPSGSGTMNYSDGDTHEGEWSGGAPAGQRRMPLPEPRPLPPPPPPPPHHRVRSPPQHHHRRPGGPGGLGSPLLQRGGYRTPTGRSYLETLDEDAPPPHPAARPGLGRMPLGRPSGTVPGARAERRVVCGMAWSDRRGDTGLYTGEVDEDGNPDGVGSMRYDGGVVAEGVWSGGLVDGDRDGPGPPWRGCGASAGDASAGHASYSGLPSSPPTTGGGGLDRLGSLPGAPSGRRVGGSASVH